MDFYECIYMAVIEFGADYMYVTVSSVLGHWGNFWSQFSSIYHISVDEVYHSWKTPQWSSADWWYEKKYEPYIVIYIELISKSLNQGNLTLCKLLSGMENLVVFVEK